MLVFTGNSALLTYCSKKPAQFDQSQQFQYRSINVTEQRDFSHKIIFIIFKHYEN